MEHNFREKLSVLVSSMYAVFLVTLGGVIALTCQNTRERHSSEIFTTIIAYVSLIWLVFFNVDLHRYKKNATDLIKQQEGMNQSNEEQLDQAANDVCNTIPSTNTEHFYGFLMGRHSGSFYLKAGMAVFCFGHMIHEGLRFGQQILSWYAEDYQCLDRPAVELHVVRPILSFYQLFIIFKYSNIIINRHRIIARFGSMHLIGTSLCNWINSLVLYAIENHVNNQQNDTTLFFINSNTSASTHYMKSDTSEVYENDALISRECYGHHVLLSPITLKTIPYLYPFTIEYNVLLAGVWLIVWQNIGRRHSQVNPHPFCQKIDIEQGIEKITYRSNFFISADCHASNKGLFAGLFLLLVSIITVIVFFVSAREKKFLAVGITIHTFQEGIVTGISLICVLIAFRQTSQLDINLHPITLLDDVLMFIPLPFFFANGIISVMTNFNGGQYVRTGIYVLIVIQVVVQTLFIVDGLRRCSNSSELQFKKPGRELVTFLIICNLSMWIINTFEHKIIEPYNKHNSYFDELGFIVTQTTHPLMLFYRFHSSVCLADVWKSAYEIGE
ncbi:proton channel OtopLc-like [Tachypleus tridentatus]|uniref:proton channel OtopLc-like n=1 Tax=Tachypleus tridentatus TaxID=6853 RepID=UPI003FD54444